jgi:hypothetical protein
MPANNRDIDSNTRSYMTRFGVDWKNEAFREEYWSYRDFWAQVQGNGMLPEATLFELAYRHRPGQETAVKETKKGGKAA